MYAELIINHPISRSQESWTYKIPEGMHLIPGMGVEVPFKNKNIAGLVVKISNEAPSFKTREITALISERPLMQTWQIELAHWTAEYYFCSLFDAIKCFLPKHSWKAKTRVNKKNAQAPALEKKGGKTMHELSPKQAEILKNINAHKDKIHLLQGITGSGKTEIYKHLIATLDGQVLLLVPEISLTPQFIEYFRKDCPSLRIIHSRLGDKEKLSAWQEIKNENCKLIIGSRSAIFAPFQNLKLIIVDEEHESSYKQDQNPKYHAVKLAEKMKELCNASLVLGSATPSLETRYRAATGEIMHHRLEERIHGTPLPEVFIVDMREELKAGNKSVISDELEKKILENLAAGLQVLLFLNRRGSASCTLCRDCGESLNCAHCALPLTYHARTFSNQTLICHHCGKMEKMPTACPNCKSLRIKHLGSGTQSIEDELKLRFPKARLARADKDSMKEKLSFEKLHASLQNGEIDILIGTQMIAKGWDLDKLGLVGVIMADIGLHRPDIRASERGFQLLTQVAGRAGRREKRGQVLIQTYNPKHPSITYAQTHDYEGFYEQEIYTRKMHGAPPFAKLIKCTIVGEKQNQLIEKATQFKKLCEEIDAQINAEATHKIYSAPAFLSKIKDLHYWHVFIEGQNPDIILKHISKDILKEWRVDVDPNQML